MVEQDIDYSIHSLTQLYQHGWHLCDNALSPVSAMLEYLGFSHLQLRHNVGYQRPLVIIITLANYIAAMENSDFENLEFEKPNSL
mgnify:CR=1 FL=1